MPQGLPARGVGRLARALAAAALLAAAFPSGADSEERARGEYLFRAAGCEGCHTEEGGERLAGGRALTTPFGVFYAPNITPDTEHGIGGWSEADFIRALREGVAPDGRHYYPAFPYPSYTRLTDADLRAIRAYLLTLPAVARPNREHALVWYARFRPALRLWKARYFTPGPFMQDPNRSPAWNRGAYLANAAAHCGECHTPRDRLGGARVELFLAGTRSGPEGKSVPNITPDRGTGIGRWRPRDLAHYLRTGMTPDGDFAGGAMAEVIDNGLRHLDRADLEAIGEYLLSLPPRAHAVREERKNEQKDEWS